MVSRPQYLLLLILGPYVVLLTDLLDFNIGILCLRVILKCSLKAPASVPCSIKQTPDKEDFAFISKCILYEVEYRGLEYGTTDSRMEVVCKFTWIT